MKYDELNNFNNLNDLQDKLKQLSTKTLKSYRRKTRFTLFFSKKSVIFTYSFFVTVIVPFLFIYSSVETLVVCSIIYIFGYRFMMKNLYPELKSSIEETTTILNLLNEELMLRK